MHGPQQRLPMENLGTSATLNQEAGRHTKFVVLACPSIPSQNAVFKGLLYIIMAFDSAIYYFWS